MIDNVLEFDPFEGTGIKKEEVLQMKNKVANDTFEKRARELVAQMALEEKVFQTLHWAAAIDRLGIPAYNYWNEALHGVARAGVATVFPQAIGLAATFDEAFLEQVADTISTEGRGKYKMQSEHGDRDIYKGLTFWSPNVNIFRDPRWGRGHETLGEDPYLSSRLGTGFVHGIQGRDDKYLKAAACAKHFAVHSGPEDIRHSFNAECSEQDLRETYLPAFKTLVEEADVEVVMGAYNRTNGEPCCGSERLLVDILRGEWKFEGHVTSDCWAIRDFHEHHKVTANAVESVALAMNRGCDLNCGHIYVNLLEAVKEGLVTEETLSTAVTRLLTTRMKLGLFDPEDQVPYASIGYDQVDSKANRELNLKAAEKCVVLLKNENNILPLKKDAIRTIGVIGPNADNRKALVGNYEGTASRYITILEGIQDYVGDDIRVRYSEGCHLCKEKVQNLAAGPDRMAEVQAVCEESDVIIACMGLDAGLEGEEGDQGNQFASGDKPNLNLPGIQEDVLKLIVASGKPVVLVLLSGSALAVTYADENIPAILQGWYPGAQGGKAIAKILFGEACPEGKLPITFYRTTEELPAFTDYNMKGRTYRYMKNEALYPFGYGLSYTKLTCSASVSTNEIVPGESVLVTAEIENTGNYDTNYTLQAYVKYLDGDETTPNCQLKGIKKVPIAAGERKTVTMEIPAEAFALYNKDGQLVLNKGAYKLFIGDSQPDSRSAQLTGQAPACFDLKCVTVAGL